MKKPVVLCILDGWGDEKQTQYNAPKIAHTPTFDGLLQSYPSSHLQASGTAVGLPDGQMGNSEVGHTNIGAGRIVLQTLPRIDTSCASRDFLENPEFLAFINRLKTSNGTAHVMGIVSDGGVHGHQSHMITYVNALLDAHIPVCLHVFTDGRDTPPTSAKTYIQYILDTISAPIATITGRYFAMDRDTNWNRVQNAHDAIALGQGKSFDTALDAINYAYSTDTTDEFIPASIIGRYTGFADGDAILCTNFRADRAREILSALCDTNFDVFPQHTAKLEKSVGMISYSEHHDTYMGVLYPPYALENTLGAVVAKAGKTQIRTAETEKYPHVTFFLNGGTEDAFVGEERLLTPSPKVATYDLQPEMSIYPLTDTLINRMARQDIDLVVLNFANPDMVGHTGDLDATVQACEAVDTCLGTIWNMIQDQQGVLIVTADHGNCDIMFDHNKGEPHTAHTLNPVPFIVCGAGNITLKNGVLGDIAPTILHLMNIDVPMEMTGTCLID